LKKKCSTTKDAKEYGIDVGLLEYNLSLSFDERLQQHEKARQLLVLLQRAVKKSHGKSK